MQRATPPEAGRVLSGATIAEIGADIFERLIAVASGQPGLSEAQGIGEDELSPRILGATMEAARVM